MISRSECVRRFPSHIIRKYHGEVADATGGPCARCGVNVADGPLAVGFTDAEIWKEDTK